MRRYQRFNHLLLLLVLCIACAVPGCVTPALPPLLLPLARHEVDPLDFPRAHELLSGFDAPGDHPIPRPGDEILFGIAIETPGESGHWYLHITLLPPEVPEQTWVQPVMFGRTRRQITLESPLATIHATLRDADLHVIYKGTTSVPEMFFSHGLMLTLDDTPIPPDDIEALTAQAWAYMGIAAFAQALGRFEAFERLIWKVVDRPPAWALLTGVTLTLEFDEPSPTTLDHPALAAAGTDEAVQVPMALIMNRRTALRLSVLAGPAVPPVGLSAGTLSIEGENPRRAEARVRAKLLAARRGPLLP